MKAPNAISAAADSGQFLIGAGQVSASIGYENFLALFGTISPNDQLQTPGNGTMQIFGAYTFSFQLFLVGPVGFANNDNTFSNVQLRGIFTTGQDQVLVNRAAAVYRADNGSGFCDWKWGQPEGWPSQDMVNGNEYALDFDK